MVLSDINFFLRYERRGAATLLRRCVVEQGVPAAQCAIRRVVPHLIHATQGIVSILFWQSCTLLFRVKGARVPRFQ